MGLLLQLHHRVKMLVVDVSVNPKQTLQDGFGHRHEVLWKGNSCEIEDGNKCEYHKISASNGSPDKSHVNLIVASNYAPSVI